LFFGVFQAVPPLPPLVWVEKTADYINISALAYQKYAGAGFFYDLYSRK